MNHPALVFERTLNASPGRVWRALTDKDQMKEWYFDIPEFKAEPGFMFSFYGKGKEGERYKHLCTVKEAMEPHKLSYSWRYEGYEGDSLLTFELFEEGTKTRLKLTHDGLETFPPLAAFARENFAGGWTYFMDTGLPQYLEKTA